MDKDDRIQLMKQKIQALQKQREKIDTDGSIPFVSHITKVINVNDNPVQAAKTTETVSISVQTDVIEETDSKLTEPSVITYDVGIQTDEYEDNENTEARNVNITLDIIPEKQEEQVQVIQQEENRLLKSEAAIINENDMTLKKETFSLKESLEATLETSFKQLNDDLQFNLVQKIETNMPIGDVSNVYSVDSDIFDNFLVSVIHIESKYVKSSSVQVSHVFSGEVLDTVVFQGQNIMRCKFIHNSNSKITSILLTCYTGKIILYELRTIKINGNFKIERNIISKNYHNYPVFSIIPQKFNTHAVLLASTDGQLKSVSTLDLSLKSENNIKITPLPRTDLLYSKENTDKDTRYMDHLITMSLYDELSILCMLTLPTDPSFIYLGCEDGFIFKIGPLPLKADKKANYQISKDNNGFLPMRLQADYENESLFHEGPVLGMCACKDIDGVFFSYSLDGTCIFWDTINNKRIAVIEMDDTIISGHWIESDDAYFAGLLSPSSLRIFKVLPKTKEKENLRLSDDNFSQVINISPNDTSLSEFRSVQFLTKDDTHLVLLSGDDNSVYCYFIKDLNV